MDPQRAQTRKDKEEEKQQEEKKGVDKVWGVEKK